MDNLVSIAETLAASDRLDEVLTLGTCALHVFVLQSHEIDLGAWGLRRVYDAVATWRNEGQLENSWNALVVAPLSVSGLEALTA